MFLFNINKVNATYGKSAISFLVIFFLDALSTPPLKNNRSPKIIIINGTLQSITIHMSYIEIFEANLDTNHRVL